VNSLRYLRMVASLSLMLLSACSSPPGRPASDSEIVSPSEVNDFKILYAENCAACHGTEGRGGAAIALADPVYLAVVDASSMRKIIANGLPKTSMPAFAQNAGGMLTDKQIDVITNEIRARWSRPGILDGTNPPSYAARSAGNVQRGEASYRTYCSSCHGLRGQGGPKGSAITNDSFLALVSDQGLRTIVIAGRPELGAPDWRRNAPGKPMSDEEITDVVAWLASQRVPNPGQPYPNVAIAQH
jgi:cytochrome c oxidase cbb3-type subunit III